MNTRELKIGDRVRVLPTSHWYDDLRIDTGTIICNGIDKQDLGIKFDEPIRDGKGHDLNGYLSQDEEEYGYYIEKKCLEPLKGGNYNVY